MSGTQRLSSAETDRTIRQINVATILYGIGEILYLNSFMLLYFAALGIPSERILIYLALPSVVRIASLIPFAHHAERIGKVRLGVHGLWLGTASMLLLAALGSLPAAAIEPVAALAMVVFGLGFGMYLNSWFPLLATIVPEDRRGRFFGTMRLLYQSAAIAFTFAVAWTLERHTAIVVFQCYLGAAVLLRLFGTFMYARLPDLDRQAESGRGMRETLRLALTWPGFLPFCAYCFLLSLFTGACASLFGLLAKDTLGLPEGQVMLIGNLVTLGSLGGFFFGGRLVDRLGTKHVFILCHLLFAAVLLAVLGRDLVPLPTVVVIGALATGFGLVQAASGVAFSSELLAAIPAGNKAMATAVNMALIGLGAALSGIASSLVLKLGLLSPQWTLFGNPLGPYDALLLLCGTMVLLLIVTLGLVPSVMRRPTGD